MYSSASIHKYPDYPRVAVSCVVWKGDRVLMVKRKNPPAKGTWAPPGGSVKLGETCFDAVKREVLEETGINVSPIRTMTHVDAIYKDGDSAIRYHYVILYIEAKYISGTPVPGDDAEDAGWFTLEELSNMKVEKETIRILTNSFHLL
ncbi:NUDIX hydrolase [Dissulfuribacter thermophilus]|nr:NUDIX hydrolase [Dissulfuribacter thermophilus]